MRDNSDFDQKMIKCVGVHALIIPEISEDFSSITTSVFNIQNFYFNSFKSIIKLDQG